jgi:hypothetical protein
LKIFSSLAHLSYIVNLLGSGATHRCRTAGEGTGYGIVPRTSVEEASSSAKAKAEARAEDIPAAFF